ncbi:hypothetical protein BCR42DRAFT_413593 [Absidia repens]|uniref:G-patch domain-containing protein n=1 Tax=Absidia repens TaxID=90262 RepID=A0A1X2IHS7_9FUNG|nr:hypothetical protein BCR42DRAFT_413593 [Absidia repens]
MAKNKNRKINKNSTRSKQKKTRNYKSSHRGGGKVKAWDQPNHLQHYQDIPTEYCTESDFDLSLLEKPSLAHLDLDDSDLDGMDLQDPTTNRFFVLNQQHQDPSQHLNPPLTTSDSATYPPLEDDFYFDNKPADINNAIINDVNSDDCFFFDGTPADISFDATIIVNGNENCTKNQDSTMSTTPDIQSLSIESKRAKKKRKQHRNKVQKAKKIIPGDDICIEISSDDEDLTPLTPYNNPMDPIEINSDDDDDDDDGEDMTYTFQEESALDQDFIENTDPDSWQQLQQWATKRSVDDQQYGRLDDFESTDSDDIGDDSTIQTGLLPFNEGGGAISDFGLGDSEDDEFIQQYIAHQQHQHHKAQHLQSTIQNTLPDLPPSLHAGIHGFLQHNRRYASRKKKSSAATLSNYNNNKDMDTYSSQLRRLDRRIQLFVNDTSRQIYQLPKMALYCRQLVEGLVKLYHLKVSSDNSTGEKIGLSLRKCPATQLPNNRQSIEKYIEKARIPERTKRRMERRLGTTMKTRSSPSARKHQGQRRQRRSDGGGSEDGFRPGNVATARAAHGTVVGLAAAPLASNNVGHKMLAKMGWKEGDALGTNKDGIADPIQAVIRDRRRGLGA